jgi:hypothetical protein
VTDWTKLAEPFPDDEVKQRPGAATWDHRDSCQKRQCRETKDPAKHHQFSYVDARAVAQRLDDVLTPHGWQFTWTAIPGADVVHGRLEIEGSVREDAGYPNSDNDDEPLKAAVSDALKRCAVLFGIGRHLYEDNKTPAARRPVRAAPQRPATAPVAVRPHVVDTDIMEPDDDEVDGLFAEPTVRGDLLACPIHAVAWQGQFGDLWHKTADNKYCRHPDNVPKARAR